MFTNVSFLFSQVMVTLEGKLRVAKEMIVIPLQLKIFLLYLIMNKLEKNLMFTSGMYRADLFGCGAGGARVKIHGAGRGRARNQVSRLIPRIQLG